MSFKNKINGAVLIAISSMFISSGVAYAANSSDMDSLNVNEYDCSPDELRAYVTKKTDYFVNAQSSISTWEEFKRQDVLQGSGVNAPKSGNDTSPDNEESCDYFWGDIDDWDNGVEEGGGAGEFDEYLAIFNSIMKGDLSSLFGKVKSEMIKQANRIYDNAKKGVCKRLSSENVKKEVYRAADKYLDRSGYGNYGKYGDYIGKDANSTIDNILIGAFGKNGRLLNINNPKLDHMREKYIDKEVNRQVDKMQKRF